MIKKVAMVFIVCSFYAAACSIHTLAADQQAAVVQIENNLMDMKLGSETTDQAGDPALISSKTGQMIDALLQALKGGDPEALRPVIADYAAAVDLMREQQLVEECRDALLYGLYYNGWSLLQTLSGGGDQVCSTLSAGSIIADILIVLQSYQLCVIDNSEVPDEALREIICQQQKLVKTYDFVAGWAYATRCIYDVSFITYLTLIVNFLKVFAVCT
jgi:hypothetical protein